MTSTADLRVIHLAPHSGTSGVGDYADGFVAAIRPHVREVVELRHGAPRALSAQEIRAEVRRVVDLVAQHADGTPLVVHSELSGGAVVPFWATRALTVRRTATLHDPPRAVWYPFLTRGVSNGRVLNQAIHRPLHRVLERTERRALADVDLLVLSRVGAEATRALGMGRSVTQAEHVLPPGPTGQPTPPSQRPLAVGLFGHVYTGKGFDLLPALRRVLPDDIAIRVAGRGTENLPPTPGVEVLGPVDEADLGDFLGSLRLLLMPYDRPPVGGHEMLPCSGTHERAAAFGTPSLALRSTTSQALADDDLCALADGGAEGLALAAARLVHDGTELDRMAESLAKQRARREADGVAGPFLEVWSRS